MSAISLISRWYIRPGREVAAQVALATLARAVEATEPGTLAYLIHIPHLALPSLQSLPPADPRSVVFFETYRNRAAFHAHVDGPVFTTFLAEHGDLFVSSGGKPFWQVEFLDRHAGFIRPGEVPAAAPIGVLENRHPGVMVELIAHDQARLEAFYSQVFGWHYQVGSEGFAYVRFPVRGQPLLAGIGQAQPEIPGFEPGHNFYLLVDDLAATVAAAIAAGGSRFVDPVEADGYHFAMIKDPEGNPIGLITPFGTTVQVPQSKT